MESVGQKVEVWTKEWKGLSVESEIQMWDFYGLRPWILKYTPRFEKVLEAGCGLGRYVFYLSHLGIDISGLDFSSVTIQHLNEWQKKHNYDLNFIVGDVKNLSFPDNSLSGYLSFGVIEHFQEVPQKPLEEAFRALRPGGIAIITTPSISWNVARMHSIRRAKDFIKKLIGRKIIKAPFFQYEYRPKQLKNFVNESGLIVTRYSGADILYTFTEWGNFTGNNINKKSFAYKFSKIFENTPLRNIGSQAVTISVKTADKMHCFICGELVAERESLQKFDVPVCPECKEHKQAEFYRKNNKVKFHGDYIIMPPIQKPEIRTCDFCQKKYETSKLFENFGFNTNVCPSCLKNKDVNILLSNKYVQPIWRKRK